MNPAAFGGLPSSACTQGIPGALGPDRITKNVYDAAGQLLQVRRGVGTSLEQAYATYSYTLNGKREYVVDANGNRAKFSYDGFDRPVKWSFPSTTRAASFNGATPASALATANAVSTTDFEQYGYDPNGNRTSLRKRDGRTLTFTYDALNRVTSKIVPDACAPGYACTQPPASATRDVYYGYDLRGLQLYARFDSHSGTDAVVTTYDGFGRVASNTTSMGGVSRTIAYEYDANSNRTRVTHPDGAYFEYGYDGLDRMVSVAENGTSIVATLSYDAQGRRAGLSRVGTATGYNYDPISRLSGLTNDLAGSTYDVTWTYAYNPAGQIVTQTRDNDAYAFTGYVPVNRNYSVNGLNQYTAAGAVTFGYDSNGNLASDGTVSFTYDAENRLVVASSGQSTTNLVYDPLGRLWQTSGGVETTLFLYDGDELIGEYDPAGTLLRRYVHGPGDDDPLVWYEGASVGAANRRGIETDQLGSVVSITDSTGTPIAVNAYDAWGVPNGYAGNGAPLVDGTLPTGRFAYTGQVWLPELGMYYYKARIYSPTLGRFLQTDPIGHEDQMNLYAYIANDPVDGRDPTGMAGCDKSMSYKECSTALQIQRRALQDVRRARSDLANLRRERARVAGGEQRTLSQRAARTQNGLRSSFDSSTDDVIDAVDSQLAKAQTFLEDPGAAAGGQYDYRAPTKDEMKIPSVASGALAFVNPNYRPTTVALNWNVLATQPGIQIFATFVHEPMHVMGVMPSGAIERSTMGVLASSHERGVAQRTLFIITLKVMLASCTQGPVNAPKDDGKRTGMHASFQETIVLADKVTASIITDFATEVRVVIRNDRGRSVFLSPNFNATSRLLIYDRKGDNKYTAGFEGRPRRDASQEIREGSEFSFAYGQHVLDSGDFYKAERVCVRLEWHSDRGSIDSRRDIVCVARSE